MGERIRHDELDRRMEAWRMYYIDRRSSATIAEHFGVTRQSVHNWLKSLGGDIRTGPDENEAVYRDRIAATLGDADMLCAGCGIIAERHPSGLCASCRGDIETEHDQEVRAELEMFSSAAFLNNPRNIGRFDRSKVDVIKRVIPVW